MDNFGCHAHGFAWAWLDSMPTQSGGHGTRREQVMRLVAVVILVASIPFMHADEPKPPVIAKPGKYRLFDGKMTVEVHEDRGELYYFISRRYGNSVPTESSKIGKKEGLVWAIYPEDRDHVWVFYDRYLYRLEYSDLGSKDEAKVYVGREALDAAPAELVEKLPKSHVEKIR